MVRSLHRRARHVAVIMLIAHVGICAQVPGARRSSGAWRIDSKPIFDVGAETGDMLDTFGEVVGAARVPNGDIVVADAKYYSLRYFAPDGKFRREVGRKGDGPGEFQSIMRMIRCGDSLYVQERGTSVWSVFGATGMFKRKYLPVLPSAHDRIPYDTRCTAAGLLIHDGWENPADRKPGVFRSKIPFWIANSDGSIRARLGDFPSGERFGTVSQDTRRLNGTGPLPLGKQPVLAIGRTRAYVGTADSFAINVFTIDGKPLGMIRKPNVNLRTTPSDIQRFIALDTAGKPEDLKAHLLRDYKEITFPRTIPAYRNLVVDSDDDLWVERYPGGSEVASHWVVFSPTGTELAQVELPLNLTVQEIGHDYVLGIAAEPPDGVHHVKMFRLMR